MNKLELYFTQNIKIFGVLKPNRFLSYFSVWTCLLPLKLLAYHSCLAYNNDNKYANMHKDFKKNYE
jgi:hypothetical protein